MDHLFDTSPYIKGADLDKNWRAQAAAGFALIALRVALQTIGWVKATMVDAHQVQLVWSSDNGAVQHKQSVALTEFMADGKRHVCLRCPCCRRQRTRLLLIDTGKEHTKSAESYGFTCKLCAMKIANNHRGGSIGARPARRRIAAYRR